MKKVLAIAGSLCLAAGLLQAADGDKKSGPAANSARAKQLEQYDKNKNGKLDKDEREAFRKDREAEEVKRFDKNGDGKLDESEKAAQAQAKKRRATPAEPQPEKKPGKGKSKP